MIVNVCPAATSKAPPERFWDVLTKAEAYGQWTDATFRSAEPPGEVRPGTVIKLMAPALGRDWAVLIDVLDMDPQHRWIDLVAHLPLGVDNHEHLTLTETKAGGTLVRFN
jgi:hypothetical protein